MLKKDITATFVESIMIKLFDGASIEEINKIYEIDGYHPDLILDKELFGKFMVDKLPDNATLMGIIQ